MQESCKNADLQSLPPCRHLRPNFLDLRAQREKRKSCFHLRFTSIEQIFIASSVSIAHENSNLEELFRVRCRAVHIFSTLFIWKLNASRKFIGLKQKIELNLLPAGFDTDGHE